ncbi:MAG: arsenic efflux protein [Clostridiales bacterium]|nr:arsenic efflux protein [Clostridiales bacterium]
MWDVVLDALIDSSIAAPFLLVIYLLIEFLERNQRAKNFTVRLLNGKLAPMVAGGVGLVPQCGFSVMATDLYCQDYLKMGTLIAFFVATSDEALPILLTNRNIYDGSGGANAIWIVLLVKIVYAVALGYLINLFDKRKLASDYQLNEEEGCCHHDVNDHHEEGKDANVKRIKKFWNFVKHPLLHTLKIFVYIFVVNAVFGLLLNRFNDEIIGFTSKLGFAQSFFTSLIGLIPNCASSVIIAGMYADKIIELPALLAGLVSNSGIALAILFKDRKHWRRNLVILAIMYFAGVILGISSYFILGTVA